MPHGGGDFGKSRDRIPLQALLGHELESRTLLEDGSVCPDLQLEAGLTRKTPPPKDGLHGFLLSFLIF